jgi:cell wall-associated NlpC family hydrolase
LIDQLPQNSPRTALIAAAEGWIGTGYEHAQRLRNVAVDCVNLLCAVYEEAGLTEHIVLPYYCQDWMLHRSEELFLMGVLERRLHEVTAPLPGDVALFRYGRCYSHGAIVTQWPELIHSFAALGGVVRGDATRHPLLDAVGQPRPVKFYSMLD